MERTEQAKEVWHKAFENLVDDMKGLTREQLASGFFELGWRAADENPPKGTLLIKWQTGEPKENGFYLVTFRFFNNHGKKGITKAEWYNKHWYIGLNYPQEEILAWCKLSDVEVFKE